MASKFKFKLLTGPDPQAQYDAIAVKDEMTFYLLKTGVGYLGTVNLFDSGDAKVPEIITDMLGDGYTGDDITIASTKAIVDYVTDKVSNISTVLTTSFFRKVESHTLTAADMSNAAINKPSDAAEGDVGLLFTADIDGEDGGETYYFISLKNYLANVYGAENSKSINMTLSTDNKFKADLNIKVGEESIKVDEVNGGVYLEKATTINDGDGSPENGPAPSAAKLVTEEALVNYVINSVLPAVNAAVTEALQDVVTATVDDGSSSAT